jgi:membrane protein YqaA with SNARE-associated domain
VIELPQSLSWVLEHLFLGTFIVCFVSGVIPVVNAELFLLALVPFLKTPYLEHSAVISATLGQMLSKVIIFGICLKGMDNPWIQKKAPKKQVHKWHNRLEKLGWKAHIVSFMSAFVGFPPYFVLTVVLGFLRTSWTWFLITGFLGRGLRFAILVYFPKAALSFFDSPIPTVK